MIDKKYVVLLFYRYFLKKNQHSYNTNLVTFDGYQWITIFVNIDGAAYGNSSLNNRVTDNGQTSTWHVTHVSFTSQTVISHQQHLHLPAPTLFGQTLSSAKAFTARKGLQKKIENWWWEIFSVKTRSFGRYGK